MLTLEQAEGLSMDAWMQLSEREQRAIVEAYTGKPMERPRSGPRVSCWCGECSACSKRERRAKARKA